MKLNFWQWLGIALLILGVILVFRSRTGNGPDEMAEPRTTQPAS